MPRGKKSKIGSKNMGSKNKSACFEHNLERYLLQSVEHVITDENKDYLLKNHSKIFTIRLDELLKHIISIKCKFCKFLLIFQFLQCCVSSEYTLFKCHVKLTIKRKNVRKVFSFYEQFKEMIDKGDINDHKLNRKLYKQLNNLFSEKDILVVIVKEKEFDLLGKTLIRSCNECIEFLKPDKTHELKLKNILNFEILLDKGKELLSNKLDEAKVNLIVDTINRLYLHLVQLKDFIEEVSLYTSLLPEHIRQQCDELFLSYQNHITNIAIKYKFVRNSLELNSNQKLMFKNIYEFYAILDKDKLINYTKRIFSFKKQVDEFMKLKMKGNCLGIPYGKYCQLEAINAKIRKFRDAVITFNSNKTNYWLKLATYNNIWYKLLSEIYVVMIGSEKYTKLYSSIQNAWNRYMHLRKQLNTKNMQHMIPLEYIFEIMDINFGVQLFFQQEVIYKTAYKEFRKCGGLHAANAKFKHIIHAYILSNLRDHVAQEEQERIVRDKAELEKAALKKAIRKKQKRDARKKAKLEKAKLEKAKLEKAALEKAALEKAALEKAKLEKAALEKHYFIYMSTYLLILTSHNFKNYIFGNENLNDTVKSIRKIVVCIHNNNFKEALLSAQTIKDVHSMEDYMTNITETGKLFQTLSLKEIKPMSLGRLLGLQNHVTDMPETLIVKIDCNGNDNITEMKNYLYLHNTFYTSEILVGPPQPEQTWMLVSIQTTCGNFYNYDKIHNCWVFYRHDVICSRLVRLRINMWHIGMLNDIKFIYFRQFIV